MKGLRVLLINKLRYIQLRVAVGMCPFLSSSFLYLTCLTMIRSKCSFNPSFPGELKCSLIKVSIKASRDGKLRYFESKSPRS